MQSDEYPKVAEYFVVAGLTESSQPLEEDLAFPNANHKLSDQKKDPITDICVINKTLEENCPQGFTCIEYTPTGFSADLNHGSFTAHNLLLCYKRGKGRAPLIDLGVYYEGLETVRNGISILETTPAGRSANVNNKSGMGSHPIYLTFRRAKETAPQNALVVTDICIILTNKGERAPYAFCQIEKNLNKGLIGSSVHLCYKKSMRQVDSIPYKAGFIGRYPSDDSGFFSLPATVPLFCLPMGATIECWSSKTRHPLPTFSSFVLTTETSEKVFGAVVSFYENYPEEKLSEQEKHKLGLLRGDGQRSRTTKTIHTNKAICLLSRWPMFNAFRDFLMYLYRMTVSPIAHPVPVERHIAHFIHNVPFPTAARPRVQYQMSPMHLTILTRPQITPIPLSGASFLALLDDLGPENLITLIVLALTEHKIVIHSLRPAEITCVAEALITLLFPFKWQCTYVPLCPLEMGYVLEAPCPFIVGVDSRYFDLYEPPSDVACINLDTNSITLLEEKKQFSWKLLPRKPVKTLRSTLQRYFKEVKECPREESAVFASSSMLDPDMTRTERHRQLELAIQEAVLKMMSSLMKGYRQYLLPITEAPSAGTTDPSSLFNIQEFLRSRERASQRFFSSLMGTQLFSSFIEERSLTSFIGGGEGAAGRLASLVFFDECIDRLGPDHASDNVKLIEADDSLKSEHTVMIMPPDETGLPEGVGYQYTIFPELVDELFVLDDVEVDPEHKSGSLGRTRRKSDTFTFGRRTKQEVRTMHKMSKLHSGDSRLWARLLLSHTYGAWFACLPAFVMECRHKAAALRTAHDALHSLKEKECTPLPDETYYRMLFHLCSVYNKPALAVRLFQFVRKTGTQLSAITYGLYNKAVLEGTWPASNRDGFMLWQKLRNVFLAMRRFRYGLRRKSAALTGSEGSSDFDTTSHTSVESQPHAPVKTPEERQSNSSSPKVREKGLTKTPRLSHREEDSGSTGGQSDLGYNSMPKDEIRRGSPLTKPKPRNMKSDLARKTNDTSLNNNRRSTKNSDTMESSLKNDESVKTTKDVSVKKNSSFRSVQPPNTLNIPELDDVENNHQNNDPGLKSDETLVNGEIDENNLSVLQLNRNPDDISSRRSRSSPISPDLHRKPGRAVSIVKSASSGGGSCDDDDESVLPVECSHDSCVVDETDVDLSFTHPSINYKTFLAYGDLSRIEALMVNGDSMDIFDGGSGEVMASSLAIPSLSNLTRNELTTRKLHAMHGQVIPENLSSVDRVINFIEDVEITDESPDCTNSLLKRTMLAPVVEVTDYSTNKSLAPPEVPAQNSTENTVASGQGPLSPLSPGIMEDNVFTSGKEPNLPHSAVVSKNDQNSTNLKQQSDQGNETPVNMRGLSTHSSGSPATPEMASLFGSDSKFLSSLSDSDQKRYQELCCHRSSSLDPEHIEHHRTTRHGSLMLYSNQTRGRSSSALYSGGGISPLIGQNTFAGGSHPNTPSSRPNFDNLTAEDLGASPTRSIMGVRSGSGSILTNKNRSPNRLLATSDSPSHRRSSRKMAGSNTLAIVDGIPMLTSTPLKPLEEIGAKNTRAKLSSTNTSQDSKPDSGKSKQAISRQDISHLAEDPLSPGCEDIEDPLISKERNLTKPNPKTNSLSRHLVDEIEDHLKKDKLVRCSSDATLVVDQKERLARSNEHLDTDEGGESKLQRKASLPSRSPTLPRKQDSSSLPRSTTHHNESTDTSRTWFGSGSKFNSLLKATTVGMASKAKKVATNLAKDLNETMQASLAYYTPEKIKGSLSDLSLRSSQEDLLSKSSSEVLHARKQLLVDGQGDHYSSHSSLKSCESIHSAVEAKTTSHDKVSRRPGGRKKSQQVERPLSMPQFDSTTSTKVPPLASSFLSVPGGTASSEFNITASMTSLNTKGICDVEVTISSCSKCHKCASLVYDEEIMAGWIPDESSLNTHCPFCNSLFVPFLNIEITDYRLSHQRPILHLFKASPAQKPLPESAKDDPTVPVEEIFAATHTLPSSSDTTLTGSGAVEESNNSLENRKISETNDPLEVSMSLPAQDFCLEEKEMIEQASPISTTDCLANNERLSDPDDTEVIDSPDTASESHSADVSEVQSLDSQPIAPIEYEPVAVPYLSSLVLRKELESLLENEGTAVLTEPGFVDHHPIIYWNLIWYFRRLNLHSNLYNLLLQSQLVQAGSNKSLSSSQSTKSSVLINLMWDNLKLHDDADKPPLYCEWHHMMVRGVNEENRVYSSSFLENIKESIVKDDVRSPLVAMLNELYAQQGLRRSAYREILYFVIVALGKASIDIDAFDREYKRAYEALNKSELGLTKKCDRPPSEHAMDCRNIFGELDLYK